MRSKFAAASAAGDHEGALRFLKLYPKVHPPTDKAQRTTVVAFMPHNPYCTTSPHFLSARACVSVSVLRSWACPRRASAPSAPTSAPPSPRARAPSTSRLLTRARRFPSPAGFLLTLVQPLASCFHHADSSGSHASADLF